jgi:2-haloacid dehalogenase
VPAALADLRERGWRLAILSNTDPDFLDASIRAIGVPVDRRVAASEIGSYKPGVAHWQVFFERSGADRAGHVHVAASLFHDIEPAVRQGLRAVWINRLLETSDLWRDGELSDLAGLPDLLELLIPAS